MRFINKLFGKAKKIDRNEHNFPEGIDYSELTVDVFDKIKGIKGWFNIDDCAHFYLLLSYQSALGIKGDIFEIGSFFGRSTAMLGWCLKEGENLFVCDAFELETKDKYSVKPSPEILIRNIKSVTSNLSEDRIKINKCLSIDLHLPKEQKFRFIHIDGGHSQEQVIFDLNLSNNHLITKGIVSIDDYANMNWPEVKLGVDKFLYENRNYKILADLNRAGANGRKIYLIKY